MRKIYVLAAREYLAAVRTKSFLASLVLMPLLMGGGVGTQVLIEDYVNRSVKHFAVIDRSPGERIFAVLDVAVARHRNTAERNPLTRKQRPALFAIERVEPGPADAEAVERQRLELSSRVRRGELAGFLEIGPDIYDASEAVAPANDRAAVRYQSNNAVYDVFPRWAERVIDEAVVSRRCANAGLPREQLKGLVRPVPVRLKGLTRFDPATGALEDDSDQTQLVSILAPAGLTMLMLMVVLVSATPLMQGVVEEKAQRIAEVLLGSVRPFFLMLGKLLGMMAVSLTLATVYLGGTIWVLHRNGFTEFLSPWLIVWFVVYQVLAIFMYGSLFIGIGAACTDLKETQLFMLPVVLVLCLPLFGLGHVIQEPNSSFALWMSFFPPGTPMLMVARLSVPPGIPLWQPLLGAAGVLLTTLACVWAAGRVFRIGILMQGKGARLSELVHWIVAG